MWGFDIIGVGAYGVCNMLASTGSASPTIGTGILELCFKTESLFINPIGVAFEFVPPIQKLCIN